MMGVGIAIPMNTMVGLGAPAGAGDPMTDAGGTGMQDAGGTDMEDAG